MGLKDFYFALEDKWYGFWDKVDSVIPVNGVIEKIDSIIPSFILFLIVLLIIIFLLAWPFFYNPVSSYEAKFLFKDSANSVVSDSVVSFVVKENGFVVSSEDIRTSVLGSVLITDLRLGQEIIVDANLTKGSFNGAFVVGKNGVDEEIKLKQRIVLQPITRNIYLEFAGRAVQEQVRMDFSCENVSVIPEQTLYSNDGVVRIVEPVNCIRLMGRIVSDVYENTLHNITSTAQTIILTKPEPARARVKISVKSDGLPVSDASFKIKLDGENTYSRVTSSISETFEVVYGTYFLSVSDPDNDYGTMTKSIVVDRASIEEVIEVSKTIKSDINVIVSDSRTGEKIEEAIITVKNVNKKVMIEKKTDKEGKTSFAITEKGKVYITAKKPGQINEGYFSKEIEVDELKQEMLFEIKLDRITINNAGKTIVRVIDQDDEIVSNARVSLRYEKDDSLVELNETQNFVLTDVNGYATFLAGKPEGLVYAHANKYPFAEKSESKTIQLEGDNEFEVVMQVGETSIEIRVVNERGETVDGEAKLFSLTGEEVSGLLAIENGVVRNNVKGGRLVYLGVDCDGYEKYFSEPRFLWPNKKELFDVVVLTEISEPKIISGGKLEIFNEDNQIVRTMKAGNKYYTLIRVDSDQSYNSVKLHFRAGREELLENDFIEIDKIESSGGFVEVRGKSFSPSKGYEFDSDYLTDSLAKWVTLSWNNFGKNSKVIKIHFNVKSSTPNNKELQFFWRASFDDTKKPESNAVEELYDDVYSSNIFFVGEEAVCMSDFCITHENLFDEDEQLFVDKPFLVEQVKRYTYTFQILNNSETDYGKDKKRIGLNLEMISNNLEGAKIVAYRIKDSRNEVTGLALKSLKDLEIGSFEKNTTIEFELQLEGNKPGNSLLQTGLKSDGRIIFVNEEGFNVSDEKELSVSIDQGFIPSLINTPIIVSTNYNGEPVSDVMVSVFAKEPGFDEYLIEDTITNKLGAVMVNSGAHFSGTKIIIEVAKKGFSRKRLVISVSEDVVFFNPEQLNFLLNTITNKEEKQEFEVSNATGKKLEIYGIRFDADSKNALNEEALQSYLNSFKGKVIGKEDVEVLDMMIRINNSLTQDMMLEPISIKGTIIISLRALETNIIFDAKLPVTINIGSGAEIGSACLLMNNSVQKSVTEKGKVIFRFELQNACEANEVPIKLSDLTAVSTNEIDGVIDLSIQSYSTPKSGRSALDSVSRKVLSEIGPGEKLSATLTFVPNENAVGKTISIPLTLQARFQNAIIATDPTTAKFSVDVINLKECITIDSQRNPVAFDEESSVTIDASNCLGQTIDVWLCKNDSGCGGGAPEGKVTLGKNNFSLKDGSETISVMASDLPGSYGVSVWARVKGKSSWTYVGETPVAFREPAGKFFSINKYEVNVIGNGMQDTILLTNKMLDQEVKVRATNKVWGKQKPRIDWLKMMGAVSIGAGLGNMIGGAIPRSDKSPESARQASAVEEVETKTQNESETYTKNLDNKIQELERIQKENPNNFTAKQSLELSNAYRERATYLQNINSMTNSFNTMNLNDKIHVYKNSKTGVLELHQTPVDLYSEPYRDFRYSGTITSNTLKNGEIAYSYSGVGKNLSGSSALNSMSGITEHVVNQNATSSPSRLYSWTWKPSIPKPPNASTKPLNEVLVNSDSKQIVFDSTNWDYEKELSLFKQEKGNQTLLLQNTQGRSFAGIGTVVGAILGGALGWYMQDQARDDYMKEYAIASYRDFVILLQGDNISVSSPDGKVTEERVIPGDAGALNFSLSGIGVDWDFTNSDYSTIENVGLKFSNNGLNDAKPKYGTLIVNATVNKHGTSVVGEGLFNNSEYDVTCNEPTFGNYWVGSTEDAGLCTGITQSNYSQKYHIRVVSGEPSEEEAQMVTAKTCNNGILTGNTGVDAVPRIKLDWSWRNIDEQMCDYGSPNYVYCDGTQFTVTLVKKLSALHEFFRLNNNNNCPEDPVLSDFINQFDEINSITELVANGTIGVKDISVSVIDDKATARVIVENKTEEAIDTYVSIMWKGSGEPQNTLERKVFPTGTTELEFEADIPKWSDAYFFTAVANGPRGNGRVVTRAFTNLPPNMDCWVQPSTRLQGGTPGIMYYLSEPETTLWTSRIPNVKTLLEYINFGSYLIRENYSQELFKDVANYYLNRVFEVSDDTEKEILRRMSNGDFSITKRFSTQASMEAGLYDVWLNIDFFDDFDLLKEETSIDASLLLIRVPSDMSPLYKIPFDGPIGGTSRPNYGVVYSNQGNSDIIISGDLTTSYNSVGNGVVSVTTNIENNFEKLNSSIGTRGQLAVINFNGSTADILFSPNYATPVIGKYSLSGTSGRFTFEVEKNHSAMIVGGNLNFWTGAARSRDFFGGSAIEMYNNTPDSLLEDEYGFKWVDATHNGTLYLKTVFYVPVNDSYILKSRNGSFWSPNNGFNQTIELNGIDGMQKNQLGDYFNSLDSLLTMVRNEDVCISNDGSTLSFWWNPKKIEHSIGSNNSLAKQEEALIGN